ncbi:MAG: NYN domain-containing protein [Acidimicrobiales bacterium]|nr:NYN domain-containing protein [Acidimicrobiales bacterium]
MSADEERIALFLDYENLAIGARENLGGIAFDLKPVADALAERGRVVVRRAYADWLKFAEDGRMLTRHHVELIEIPQRMGSVRKNAADIKMAVDAMEMCFERDYITTFVLGTGDSDFTPLVHKLREHNKQVIGLGVQMSTSALLPPACDEFLFYERLEGVEVPAKGRRTIVPRGRGRGRRPQVGDTGEVEVEVEVEAEVEAPDTAEPTAPTTLEGVERLIAQTLSGLERSSGSVRASSLKRAVLRKESTFSEADYGFRGFTELLRSLADRGVIELADSSSPGDPDVQFPSGGNLGEVGSAFELLASTVEELVRDGVGTPLSGLKTQLRRRQGDFSEKRFGFGGFLQFAKAAVTRGVVEMAWSDDADDYLLTPVAGRPTFDLHTAEDSPTDGARRRGEPAPATAAEAPTTVPNGTDGTDGEVAAEGEQAEMRPRRTRGTRGGRGRVRNGLAGTSADSEAAEGPDADTTAVPLSTIEAAEPATADIEAPPQPVAAATGEPEPEPEPELEAAPEPEAVDVEAPSPDVTPTAAPEVEPEAAPAPKRRRRTKAQIEADAAASAQAAAAEPAATEPAATEPAPAADADTEKPAKKPATRRRRTTTKATGDQPAAT